MNTVSELQELYLTVSLYDENITIPNHIKCLPGSKHFIKTQQF